MKTKLIPLEQSCKLATGFMWKTHQGTLVRPCEMGTQWIFNCVKMIFNHTVEEKDRIHPYKQWNFSMPQERKIEAVQQFLAELNKREDVAGCMFKDLHHMFVVFRKYDGKKDLQ